MESGKANFPMSGEREHCRMDPPAWMILPIAREKQKMAPATREPPRIQGNGSIQQDALTGQGVLPFTRTNDTRPQWPPRKGNSPRPS